RHLRATLFPYTTLFRSRALGVSVDWSGERSVTVDAGGLRESRPDAGLASEIRASFLLAAPLLARTGLAVLPRPGGDKIGRRRLEDRKSTRLNSSHVKIS